MEYPDFLSDSVVRWLLVTLTLEQLAQLVTGMTDVVYDVTDDMDQAHLFLNSLGSQIAEHLMDEQADLFRGLLHEHGECNDMENP